MNYNFQSLPESELQARKEVMLCETTKGKEFANVSCPQFTTLFYSLSLAPWCLLPRTTGHQLLKCQRWRKTRQTARDTVGGSHDYCQSREAALNKRSPVGLFKRYLVRVF